MNQPDFKDSPLELKYTYNHCADMVVFLSDKLSDNDLAELEKIAYVCRDRNFPDDGYILYVGVDNTREKWAQFSDDFWKTIQWCQNNECEWLRFTL